MFRPQWRFTPFWTWVYGLRVNERASRVIPHPGKGKYTLWTLQLSTCKYSCLNRAWLLWSEPIWSNSSSVKRPTISCVFGVLLVLQYASALSVTIRVKADSFYIWVVETSHTSSWVIYIYSSYPMCTVFYVLYCCVSIYVGTVCCALYLLRALCKQSQADLKLIVLFITVTLSSQHPRG